MPTSLKGVSNPDSLISGAIWEVKTPTSSNEQTIKNRFREAASQSSKVIFDLRFIKTHPDKVEKQIISLYKGNRFVHRLMIIEKSGKIIDITK